jgi:endo-1,4-beta-xylanase
MDMKGSDGTMQSIITRRKALVGTAAMALATTANAATPPVDLANALAGAKLKSSGLAGKAAATQRLFGTCLNVPNMRDGDYLDLIVRESSILVPENALKANQYRASPSGFDFGGAEKIYAFASQNQMAFRGHTLVWHEAVPSWVSKNLTTLAEAKEEFYLEVREPCRHFKGRVHSWDVVNEIFLPQDGQPFGLRRSYWQQMLGPDFVDMAFLAAKEEDPDALLCLNEMDIEYDHPFFEQKRQVLIEFVKRLRTNKVPIDVIGIQAHMQYAGIRKFPFSAAVLQRFLSQIADLGLSVIISELDVPDLHLPADIAQRDQDVATATGQLVAAAVGHPAVIGVLCWGLSDRYSWLNVSPAFRRPDGLPSRAKLFDEHLQPKSDYFATAVALDRAVPPKR